MTRVARVVVMVTAFAALAGTVGEAGQTVTAPPNPTNKIDGYTNTPMLPGTEWHIHDPRRPQPKWVPAPYDGRVVPAPDDATVLFDGDDLDHWRNKGWKLDDGAMVVTKGQQYSIETFGDIQLHLEFLIPESVKGHGQGGGNSGVFLVNRYEIQVLNCYDNRTYPDGMCAAIYGQGPPRVNASRPRGTWQSYDIHFKAPVFEGRKLAQPAYITVVHNGVLVHDSVEIMGLTHWKTVPRYKPHGPKDVLRLQAHGAPVRYRNIWVRPLTLELGPEARKK